MVVKSITRTIQSSTDPLVNLSQANIENTFRFKQITKDETVKAINDIQNKNSSGTDVIAVKNFNELLRKALVLTDDINLNSAIIIPIYKGGDSIKFSLYILHFLN